MSNSFCPRCGRSLNTGGRCEFCGAFSITYMTTNNDYTYSGYIYVEPDIEAKTIMQQQEKIDALNQRIAELQERNNELEYVSKQFNPQDVLEYEIEFRKQVKDE